MGKKMNFLANPVEVIATIEYLLGIRHCCRWCIGINSFNPHKNKIGAVVSIFQINKLKQREIYPLTRVTSLEVVEPGFEHRHSVPGVPQTFQTLL